MKRREKTPRLPQLPACGSREEQIPMPELSWAEELAGFARALAHPARVRIISLLLRRDSCVCGEIVDEIPLAQSTVSQHLKVLREAGLIEGEVDGPRVCYWINHASLGRFKDLLLRL